MTDIMPMTSPNVARAAKRLCAGDLVAFPTETVYGLGADATNDKAVAKIYAAKNRPQFNPLIIHLAGAGAVEDVGEITGPAAMLIDAFWPGPLTLILRRVQHCSVTLLASAGLDTVAVRVPAHEGARELLKAAGRPVAAPSANSSGRISPTTARHVVDSLGGSVDLVLDGGPCRVGLESTVIDCTSRPLRLLRPGGLTSEMIEDTIGQTLITDVDDDVAPKSPGMLSSHYAPRAKVRLNATSVETGEVLLGFGDTKDADLNLSPAGDLTEAAANLFAYLHRLDREDVACIAVSSIPDAGLGRAINDRLRRAAAPLPG